MSRITSRNDAGRFRKGVCMNVRRRHSSFRNASLVTLIMFAIVSAPATGAVWGEISLGSCNQQPSVSSGESFSVSCSESANNWSGTAAIRGEVGSLGAKLSEDTPSLAGNGVPAVEADTRWFENLAFTTTDPRFSTGGYAYVTTTLVLDGEFSSSFDPDTFFELDVEFGIGQTGGDIVSFSGNELSGQVHEEISFVNEVWVSPHEAPEFSNGTLMGLTLRGNSAFTADFFGTLSITDFVLSENEDGSGVIGFTGNLFEGANGREFIIEPAPVPLPAAGALFAVALLVLRRLTR